MKKIFLTFITFFLAVSIASAAQIILKFEWTPNTEPDMARYLMYHKVEGTSYDYNIPIKVIPCTITDGQCVYNPDDAKAQFEVPDNTMVKNYFVVRAEDTEQYQSENSNEVWANIDLRTPPAPTILSGSYNDSTKTIDLSWEQSDPTLVSKWKFYVSNTQGGPYTEVENGTVTNDGSTEYTFSWAVPGDGMYYFTNVAFRDGSDTVNPDGTEFTSIIGSYSTNSNEVGIQVKVHPAPAKNFRVKIRVY